MSDMDMQGIVKRLDLSDEAYFSEEALKHHDYRSNKDTKKLVPKFKPEYIWSFDHTLAAFLDMGLTELMRFEYQVPEDEIERARNVFRAYATKDEEPFNRDRGFPFEDMDSPEYAELMWGFDWLKEHFSALWT